ncbi:MULTISPECIES: hypothetical protein [Sorangium]|uniref:Uncharacterized protein n=1 Tax=Sorangium cellulosum TaxID=56 RepID=A0A4P2QZ70_SORCE|nr:MULTISPECIES: hypothetical protein [Sorangium]AUX35890.1 uncharacterized protein SOCE836_080920 [Sorangium cellulosum]WCQ95190.1 hypothetical protein NQZ70_07966 [Sorangium sp. Soce836]
MNAEEWIRVKVSRAFRASVDAGIGRWSSEGDEADPEWGQVLYKYSDHRMSLALFEEGCERLGDDRSERLAYAEIQDVVPLLLTELVRVRDLDAIVGIGVRLRTRTAVIDVPLKVYSTLCPTLKHIADYFTLRAR